MLPCWYYYIDILNNINVTLLFYSINATISVGGARVICHDAVQQNGNSNSKGNGNTNSDSNGNSNGTINATISGGGARAPSALLAAVVRVQPDGPVP